MEDLRPIQPESNVPVRKKRGLIARFTGWTLSRQVQRENELNEKLRIEENEKLNQAAKAAEGNNVNAVSLHKLVGVKRGFRSSGLLEKSGGKAYSRNWSTFFTTDSDQPQTAQRIVANKLPKLLIQDQLVEVRSATIHTEHDLRKNGVSTTIWINDLVNLAMQRPPTGEEENPVRFSDAVRIELDLDGNAIFSRESNKVTGYTPIQPTETNMAAFFDGLKTIAQNTPFAQ